MKIFNRKWSQISHIHNTGAVKSLYVWLFIVPILAKALSEVPAEVNFLIAGQPIPIKMELPFSFFCFYLSAFFFVLSNLIFQFKCPQLIKDHSSWRSFAEHGKGKEHLSDYVDGLDVSKEHKEVAWHTPLTHKPGGLLQDQFWKFHDLGEWQTPVFRGVAVGLTYLAFIFMAWVIVQNLLTVVNYAFVHQTGNQG
ncbi:hypothetical protein LVW35_15460 [Pseudomonas sp. HN11]|uniref:hypothetical protein n=1 Tax=Pseudomonas sp. HN11 TaxID=1344094 RepID=UPI001F3B7069|nr:hypothetical protein [Pseudomonas sp. HN11]UII69090.1 hypothetical protein LVW35_15460 [Pseudomonas sp. HN11]